MLFTFDTLVKEQKKTLALYPRERDSSIVVNSELFFSHDSDYAYKIFRYDSNSKLRVTVYPLGNRKELRRYTDSLVENGELTIRENVYFPENSFHNFAKYNADRQLLEKGYFNFRMVQNRKDEKPRLSKATMAN